MVQATGALTGRTRATKSVAHETGYVVAARSRRGGLLPLHHDPCEGAAADLYEAVEGLPDVHVLQPDPGPRGQVHGLLGEAPPQAHPGLPRAVVDPEVGHGRGATDRVYVALNRVVQELASDGDVPLALPEVHDACDLPLHLGELHLEVFGVYVDPAVAARVEVYALEPGAGVPVLHHDDAPGLDVLGEAHVVVPEAEPDGARVVLQENRDHPAPGAVPPDELPGLPYLGGQRGHVDAAHALPEVTDLGPVGHRLHGLHALGHDDDLGVPAHVDLWAALAAGPHVTRDDPDPGPRLQAAPAPTGPRAHVAYSYQLDL